MSDFFDLNSPKQKSKKQRSKPELVLRDIQDLTLHGGVDDSGQLVFFAILNGLGLKGMSLKLYFEQLSRFYEKGTLNEILPEEFCFDLKKIYMCRANYPALSAALPLPSPVVIDHFFERDIPDEQKVQAKIQLGKCCDLKACRSYDFLCQTLKIDAISIDKAIKATEANPGLFTDPMALVLQEIKNLHLAIDQAESSKNFMVISSNELIDALSLVTDDIYRNRGYILSSSWNVYFKELRDYGEIIRKTIVDPKNRIDSDSLETASQALGNRPGLGWILLADVGVGNISKFVEAIAKIQRFGPVSSASRKTKIDYHYGWRYGLATEIIEPRGRRYIEALAIAWRIIVNRALEKKCYKSHDLVITERSQLWSKRFSSDSSLGTLLNQIPSRPIAKGGYLVTHNQRSNINLDATSIKAANIVEDVGSTLVLEPAVMKPHVAATPAKSVAKKFAGTAQQFTTLKDMVNCDKNTDHYGNNTFYADSNEQIVWPNGHLWQAIDLIKTMVAEATLFLCPEVLAHGYLKLSLKKWDELELTKNDRMGDYFQGLSWLRVYDWFIGTTPLTQKPLISRKYLVYQDNHTVKWLLTHIDGGLSFSQVQLNVEFTTLKNGTPQQSGTNVIDFISFKKMLDDAKNLVGDKNEFEVFSDSLTLLGQGLRFEARPFFEVSGVTVSEEEWFKATKVGTNFYILPNAMVIDAKSYLEKTDQFIVRKRVYAKFGALRLSDIWRVQQRVLKESASNLAPEEYIKQLNLRVLPVLEELDQVTSTTMQMRFLDDTLQDLGPILRPYQTEGIAWGYLRLKLGFGICIADEMGLGKTLQAIALIKLTQNKKQPSLVVMPKGLILNWQRELGKFGGNLSFAIYGEDNPPSTPDVWLLSYPRLRMYQDELAEVDWNLIVLDEAQAIKNSDTMVAEAVNRCQCRHRIAMTGTPIENKVSELWSIINWLNPEYLGEQADFNSYISLARSSDQKKWLLSPIREVLNPLILRRLKSDPQVALGLPEKIYQDAACELSQEQNSLYEAVIETVLAEESLAKKGLARSAVFLKAIGHLKQICIHPELFYGDQSEKDLTEELHLDSESLKLTTKIRKIVFSRIKTISYSSNYEAWLERSSKLMALRDLFENLKNQSQGILVFTQYIGAGEMIKKLLQHSFGVEASFIHGGLSTTDRQELIDEFGEDCQQQAKDRLCPVLILSLKTGGVGLNLTCADRVIHFDRWWNPAVEDQATDRAHRIGQLNTVFIHTLTNKDTIEQSIDRLFIEKRQIIADILGAATTENVGNWLANRDKFLDLVDPARYFSKKLQPILQ